MRNQLSIVDNRNYDEILEKVILKNDLSDLTPGERVSHIRRMCHTLGLNPETQPIQLIEFPGQDGKKKVMPYMAKDGTEQLRNIHNVSIVKLETEFMNNGELYLCKAYAEKPNGRVDCSTGAKSIGKLTGRFLENAIKSCETQAKRRVTLSICGLGMIDESEIDDIEGAKRVNVNVVSAQQPIKQLEHLEDDEPVDWQFLIESALNVEDLKKIYIDVKARKNMLDIEEYKRLIALIETTKLAFINNTGEVSNETV